MPRFNLRKPSFKSRRKSYRKRASREAVKYYDMRDTFQQLTAVDQERIIRQVDRETKYERNSPASLFRDLQLAYMHAKKFTETIIV